jgi:hypothetical protein
MQAMIAFLRTLFRSPKPVVIWVLVMMFVNMVMPFVFLDSLESKVVLAAFLLGGVIQIVIFSRKGFVRLLGLGHIAWVPMVAWLWSRLELAPQGSLFSSWMLTVIVISSISLVIDTADVVRYLRGEKEPLVETAS